MKAVYQTLWYTCEIVDFYAFWGEKLMVFRAAHHDRNEHPKKRAGVVVLGSEWLLPKMPEKASKITFGILELV